MVCPFCSQPIQELFQPFCAITDWEGRSLPQPTRGARTITETRKRISAHVDVQLYWAICPKCRELMVKIHKAVAYATKGASREHVAKLPTVETDWLALPQRKTVPLISSLIPDGMARDYREAYLILEDCPRMSGVLARRIVADLLEKYAGITEYTLAKAIDKFIADTKHPSRHRGNLHYLREIGDFSAHTKTDQKGNIIEISAEEAEWTLRVVSGLFDYFIVAPATDDAIRSRIDQKLKEANRKPIKKVAAEGNRNEKAENI
jgi:hypothetical protein